MSWENVSKIFSRCFSNLVFYHFSRFWSFKIFFKKYFQKKNDLFFFFKCYIGHFKSLLKKPHSIIYFCYFLITNFQNARQNCIFPPISAFFVNFRSYPKGPKIIIFQNFKKHGHQWPFDNIILLLVWKIFFLTNRTLIPLCAPPHIGVFVKSRVRFRLVLLILMAKS